MQAPGCMERLISFFNAVEPLSEQSKEIMRQRLYAGTLKKGDYFSEAGKICNHIGFVNEGILRVIYYDKNGNEYTRFFIREGHFAVDLQSFNDQVPSSEYLEALAPCKLTIVSRPAMEYFSKHIPNWTSIVRKVTERALIEKLNVRSEMVSDNATTRYQKLMERHADILQRVPLGIIASYLGVTQYTLSRIRHNYK